MKPDACSDEAHEFGAGIGVERDALLHVLGFGNPFDDVRNAQGGLPDRRRRVVAIEGRAARD